MMPISKARQKKDLERYLTRILANNYIFNEQNVQLYLDYIEHFKSNNISLTSNDYDILIKKFNDAFSRNQLLYFRLQSETLDWYVQFQPPQNSSSINIKSNTPFRQFSRTEIWGGKAHNIEIDGYSSEDETFNNRTSRRMVSAMSGGILDDSSTEDSSNNNRQGYAGSSFNDNTPNYSRLGSANVNRRGLSSHRNLSAKGLDNRYNLVEIYAYLDREQTIPHINNVRKEIKDPAKLQKYYSDEGLNVLAPNSGEVFNLKEHPQGITKATFDHTNTHDDETLALTIMNMIENVISKGGPLNLKTDDAFVATITQLYVDVLKSKGLDFDYNPPNNNFKSVKSAENIFDAILQKMDFNANLNESNCPWFSSAMHECQPTITPSIKTRF